MHIFTFYVSSMNEIEDSLPPGKAVFYTWADPVGSRKLTWKCGKCHGEVTQKDVCIGCTGYSQQPFFFFKVFSFSLASFKACFVFTLLKNIAKDFKNSIQTSA